jgi:Ca2+-transporting ATPase
MPLSAVVSTLRTNVESGLSSHEVRARHHMYGYNTLPDVEQRSTAKILLLQFKNLPIILLLVASALSYSLGRVLESIAIFSVVFMTIGFGFFMERSAEKAINSLVTLRAPKAKVLREGNENEIKAHDLVPGDIVEFEAGDKVPADCRVVESFDLVVDESPLTGESHGVRKDPDVVLGQVDLAERVNMCYMGTLVLEGRAKGLVVTTGKSTEMGKVGELLQGVSEGKTPLEHKIERLGRTLVMAVFGITGLYIAIGLLQGFEIGSILLSGIVLAIAAVPEGLPAVATITLAIGVKRMAKKNALVRRLAAAETLGSVTVICTDKTGTLTRNEPTLQAVVLGGCGDVITVTGSGLDPLGKFVVGDKEIADSSQRSDLTRFLKAGALCNNAELSHDGKNWILQGDTTEGALVVAARKSGLDKKSLEEEYERLWEDPFDSSTRKMITVHRTSDKKSSAVAYIKGAPEAVLSVCSKVIEDSELVPLDAAKVKKVQNHVDDLTAKAYRILLIAYKELENGIQQEDEYYAKATSNDFILLGIAGIYDPPREEVKDAINFVQQAKTKVVLITGDHPTTAKVVAEQLAISSNDGGKAVNAMTGSDLEKMSVEKLAEEIERISVFARATPAHKLKIVEALQRKGHVVAMTGDGVNDAPALKQADIGVAMGKKGTDVAKDSADLILLDDNFETITHALELGRLIFANIKKFVQYLFSCNISEVMTMLVAIIAALPFPLLPLQLLWMNLTINTFPALALAAEKGSKNRDYVRIRPPAKHEQMVSRKEWLDICVQASYMTAAAIAVFIWALSSPESIANDHEVAQTMAFSTLSLVQTWHVLNYSSTIKALFSKSEHINRPLIGAVALSVALLLAAIYFNPLAEILELHPLNIEEWGIVFVASVLSAVAINLTMRAFRYTNHYRTTRT